MPERKKEKKKKNNNNKRHLKYNKTHLRKFATRLE